MVRTQIQLPEEQVSTLKNLATQQHTSMAELIRRAIDMFTASTDTVSLQDHRQRALAAAGKFRSGHGDLSAKHDHYLAEVYK
ncbi:MAG: CopG family transcriptional regulator [Desulfuromonadales bacterium]|nr:CopG family transcriptional regulator [Desulfuromonadales bacterium]